MPQYTPVYFDFSPFLYASFDIHNAVVTIITFNKPILHPYTGQLCHVLSGNYKEGVRGCHHSLCVISYPRTNYLLI